MVAREVSPSGPVSLRDRQRALIVTEIRHAAWRLIADNGYDAVTTEEIAAAAGVSPRTFFRHIENKEQLLLGTLGYGEAIPTLLEARPDREAPDIALANAIVSYASASTYSDLDEWRQAILKAPHLLEKVTIWPPEQRERIVALTAQRMKADAQEDMRPALLVQLAVAAGDFAFQQWVRRADIDARPISAYVAEALEAIKHRRWRANEAGAAR